MIHCQLPLRRLVSHLFRIKAIRGPGYTDCFAATCVLVGLTQSTKPLHYLNAAVSAIVLMCEAHVISSANSHSAVSWPMQSVLFCCINRKRSGVWATDTQYLMNYLPVEDW